MKNFNARFAFLWEIFGALSWIAFASATLTLIAPAALVAQTSGSLVTSRIVLPIDENARITLKGNVRRELATAPDLGSVEDGKSLHLYLLLQRTTAQQADLDNLIQRQQQPTAPEYHQWLAPKEFGARFGASPEDIAKITAWLESHGFQVRSVLNNASMIGFAATAGQVRNTFHTELHYFNIRGGQYLANVKDPQIPAALAPVVAGIKGLIKIPAHTNHTPIRQAAYDAHTHRWHTVGTAGKAGAKPAFNDSYTGDLDVTPQDLYTIYNVNPMFSGGHLAATATVAVIEESDMEYGTVNSTTGVASGGDVATFRTLFGVPGTLNMHVYHGYGTVTCNDPGIDPDGIGEDQEASLDAEWINATAPSANLIFMSCDQDPDQGIDSSMQALIDNNLSDVMSLSYGDSELNFTTSDYSFQDTLYAQAATQGQSFFVSAGDSGSDVYDQNTNGTATSGINVSAFGSPLVTVTGGTDFSDFYDASEGGPAQSTYWSTTNSTYYGDALSYVPETAWNQSCASSIYAVYEGYSGAGLCVSLGSFSDGSVVGGSGGISTHYAVPAWQTGISGYSNSMHAQPDIAGFASATFWGHALISCDSNPPDASASGCTSEANFGEAGGTSFVAPYMAGVAGLLVDYTGSRQGVLNPALYALAKAQYTAAATRTACYSNGQTSNTGVTTGLPATACIFNDVTTSNNDVPCEIGSTDCFVSTGDSYGMLSLNGASSLTVAYPSTIGFDQVSGVGTVNVNNLITEWNTAFTSTTGLAASPTSITSSQSTELTATVTGGTPTGYQDTPPALTGTASFAAGSTSLGHCTLSAGTCKLSVPGTALQAGANSVTATFLGSGTYPSSISSMVTVTVTATNQVTVTVGTSPAGLSFSIDGTAYTSPQTPTWTIGSPHTIATTSPQNPVAGTEDTFTSWSDGGALSHAVTASASTTSYTALFSTQYLLTTAASPVAGGTVSPATGYQTAASSVSLVATPASGYAFVNWTGTVVSPTSASTSITMSAPESATANFALTGPTITSISPTSKIEGGAKFTLTVNGANYTSGATINWNGTALVTKFVSSAKLTASVPATDISSAGTALITVSDPSPGGTSNSATFTIDNPKPVITSLSPNNAIVDGAGFTLTVNGKDFINGAVVNWAGSARTTVFVSATELTATINAADIVKAGKFKVTVTNSAPGGGNSAPSTFDVDNPTPTLTDISPNSATHGGASFTLTATGTNFVSTSRIQWNGVSLATKFVNSTTLTAVIKNTDIATAGTANVTVDTPAPGGGVSAPQTFTIN
jgi:subtilase family serine protease